MRNNIPLAWGRWPHVESHHESTSLENYTASSLKTEWFDTKEAAKFLRISVKALRNASSNGQIPFYKFGRRNRYRKDELSKLLLTHKRGKHEY